MQVQTAASTDKDKPFRIFLILNCILSLLGIYVATYAIYTWVTTDTAEANPIVDGFTVAIGCIAFATPFLGVLAYHFEIYQLYFVYTVLLPLAILAEIIIGAVIIELKNETVFGAIVSACGAAGMLSILIFLVISYLLFN